MKKVFKILITLTVLSSCQSAQLFQSKNYQQFPDYEGLEILEHKIRPDDKLSLSVWEHNELSMGSIFDIYNSNEVYGKWVLVDKNGDAVFPLLDKVNVEGLSVREASDLLAEKYAEHIVDPIVVVKVLNLQVSILGEVKNPGQYKIEKRRNSLLDLLAEAGGLTYYGNSKKIRVVRGEGTVNPQVMEIDLSDADNLQKYDITIYADDVIYVPAKGKQQFDKQSQSFVAVASILTSLALIYSIIN